MSDNLMKKWVQVNKLAEKIGDPKFIELSRFLKDRIEYPDSYVAMLGETSSGKTTLLNGLLGGQYLYTSAKPATGAVIEIEFAPETPPYMHAAILKDVSKTTALPIMKLTEDEFLQHSKKPKDSVKRLLLRVQSSGFGQGRLRLFDTPGYGSLIEKHEDVLLEFLPECNLIIYAINYKRGFQQDDFEFLHYKSEILDSDTEVVLVINCTPEQTLTDDKRISEIKRYVNDCLHRDVKTFTVPSVICEEGNSPLPKCDELWEFIRETIESDKHRKTLNDALNSYLDELYNKCCDYIEKHVDTRDLGRKEKESFINELKNQIVDWENAKTDLVKPIFDDLIKAIPSKLERVKKQVTDTICAEIDNSDKLEKNEVVGYITRHKLQFETKQHMNQVHVYIEAKLNELDRKLEDKLNKSIIRIEKCAQLQSSAKLIKIAANITKNLAGDAIEQGLLGYFSQFAGRGGSGIANGTKHLLKKFGELFGKTFSRETHNKLAHILSKIGVTSVKRLSVYIVVIVETVTMIYDIATWQKELKKKITASMDDWYNDVLEPIISNIKELEEINIENIDNVVICKLSEDIIMLEKEESAAVGNLDELVTLCGEIKQYMGGNNDE